MTRNRLLVLATMLVGVIALTDVLVIKLGDSGAKASDKPTRLVAELKAPSRAPQIKEAATKPTPEGATAFVLFWFDTLNYSLARQDTELLAHWTNAGCRQCNGWLIGISRWKNDGSRLEGGLTYPVKLAIGSFSTTQPVAFAAEYLTSAAGLVGKNGSVQRYRAGRTQGGLSVLWANGRWQMTDVLIQASQAGATP